MRRLLHFDRISSARFPWNLVLRTAGLALAITIVAGRTLFPSAIADTGNGVLFTLLELAVFPFAVGCWVFERSGRRPLTTVWIWGLLLGLIALSACGASYQFPAVLMTWEWAGVGAVWLFLRQQSGRIGPMPIAALVAMLVIAQAALACWQALVELPALRAEANRPGSLVVKEMREQGYVPGTPIGDLFLDRLNSTEPFGTFAHPNSLAGFFVIGLPILWALTVPARSSRWFRRLLTAAIFLLVVTALLLTKSRSAWLAAVFAIGLYVALTTGLGSALRKHRLAILIWLAAIAVLIALVVLTGMIDREVLTETTKSLQYRLEWWEGSWGVISERPWLGVGFGNFASHYLRYKLPFSSEEIKDPHNFLVELWSSCGVLVAAAYVTLLIVACRELVPVSGEPSTQPLRLQLAPWWWIGAVAAVVLVNVFQFEWEWFGKGGFGVVSVLLQMLTRPAFIAFVCALIAVFLIEQIRVHPDHQRLRCAVLAGVAGLHLHWLAASGCSYPAFMLVLWSLLATSRRPGDSALDSDGRRCSAALAAVIVTASAVLPIVYFKEIVLPIRIRDQIVAGQRRTNDEVGWRRLLAAYEAAAQTVPADSSGWKRLAAAHTSRVALDAAGIPPDHFREAEAAWRKAIALEPRRADNYRELAKLYLEVYERGWDENAREQALAEFAKMAACYPNSATRTYQFAVALARCDRHDEAREQFQRALELDKTPHRDKRLSPGDRNRAEWILEHSIGRP